MKRILELFSICLFLFALGSCNKKQDEPTIQKIDTSIELNKDNIYYKEFSSDTLSINMGDYIFNKEYNLYNNKEEEITNHKKVTLTNGDNLFKVTIGSNAYNFNLYVLSKYTLKVKYDNEVLFENTYDENTVIYPYEIVIDIDIDIPNGYELSYDQSSFTLKEDFDIIISTIPLSEKVKVTNNITSETDYLDLKTGDSVTYTPKEIEGYVIKGLYINDILIDENYKYNPSDGNVINVVYEKEVYKIKCLNGNIVTTVSISYGDKINLNEATKKGYTFEGWLLDGNIFNETIYNYTKSITLVASFRPNTYKINYYINDTLVNTDEVTYNASYTLYEYINENTDQTFIGWFYEDTLFNSGVYTYVKDIDVYAKFEAKNININIENYGLNLSTNASTDSEGKIVFPTYEIEGYTFDGFYKDPYFQTKANDIFVKDYHNEVLYPHFILKDDTLSNEIAFTQYNQTTSSYDEISLYKYGTGISASLYWFKIGINKLSEGNYYISKIAKSGESISNLGQYDYVLLLYSACPLYNMVSSAAYELNSTVTFLRPLEDMTNGSVNNVMYITNNLSEEVFDEVASVLHAKYDSLADITSSINLVDNVNNYSVRWESTNAQVISTDGTVHPKKDDTSVTLKAYLLNKCIYEITVNVKGNGIEVNYLNTGYVYASFNQVTDNAMSKIDILYCSFLEIDNQGNFTNLTSMMNNLNTYIIPRAKKTGTKVLISINQKAGGYFSNVAASTELTQNLVNNVAKLFNDYDIQGIDIDWEVPASSEKANFTLMMKALYEKVKSLNNDYLVTAAIGGGKWQPPCYDLTNSIKYLDYVNMMTYSMVSGNSQYQNALYRSTKGRTLTSCSIDESVTIYNNNYGIPNSKILIGIPYYTVVQTGSNGPGSGTGSGKPIWYKSMLDTYPLSDTMKEYFDEECGVPYRYDETKGIFISYDNELSIKAKCDYIKNKGLAGMMFWQYNQDVNDMLTNAVDKYLK